MATTLLLSACGGQEERLTNYIERGQQHYEDANYEKARLEFKNALKIDPKAVDAIYWLALTQEKLSEWGPAAALYLKAIELDDRHVGARVRLARLYLLGRATDKARETVDAALVIEPNNAAALTVLAAVQAQENNLSAAVRTVEQALAIDETNTDAVVLRTSLYVQNQDALAAIAFLQDRLEAQPESIAYRALLAQIYHDTGRSQDAADMLNSIVDRQPKALEYHIRLANYVAEVGDLGRAENVLRAAVDKVEEPAEAKLALINFLWSSKKENDAIAELNGYIQKAPEEYRYQFLLARFQEQKGKDGDLLKTYQGIIDRDQTGPDGLNARVALANYHFRHNDVDAAKALLKVVLENNQNDTDALLLSGTIALAGNDLQGAIADFRSVLRNEPSSTQVLKLLAETHVRNNERELARDTLEQGLKIDPADNEMRLALAKLQFLNREMKDSNANLEVVLRQSPDHVGALELLAQLQLVEKEFEAVKDTTQRLLAAESENAAGHYLLGKALEGSNDLVGAARQYKQALQLEPTAVEPLSSLVKVLLRQQKTDQALSEMDTLLNGNSQNFAAHNLKGEILLFQKKPQLAIVEFEQVTALNPAFVLGYRNLATAHLANRDQAAAEQVFIDALKRNNDAPIFRVELAALYEQLGRIDDAIAEYEQMVKATPKSQVFANNLAMLLATYKPEPTHLERASQLAVGLRNSQNPAFLDTVGWVDYKLGNYASAIPSLDQAVQLSPQSAQLHYHLGMAYFKNGDMARARRHLETALQQEQHFPGRDDAKETLAQLASS